MSKYTKEQVEKAVKAMKSGQKLKNFVQATGFILNGTLGTNSLDDDKVYAMSKEGYIFDMDSFEEVQI